MPRKRKSNVSGRQDAKRMKRNRETETITEKINRLSAMATNSKVRLSQETPADKSRRLSAVATNSKVRFNQETLEERRQRINAISEANRYRKERRLVLTNRVVLHEINEGVLLEFSCGPLNCQCSNCLSLNFEGEKNRAKLFKNCCRFGRLKLPEILCPPVIYNLLTSLNPNAVQFREHIRQYNSALAFSSMGAQIKSPGAGRGPYCFKILGQVYHATGPLHPPEGHDRKYAQIYVLDSDAALNRRMSIKANVGCNPSLMNELDMLLRQINPFAQAYKMMHEVEEDEICNAAFEDRPFANIAMAISHERDFDPRRYNAVRCNEVAFVFQTEDGAPPFNRDIAVHLKNSNATQHVSILNCNLDAMTYPILFPYGTSTWHEKMFCDNNPKIKITQLQFYAYHLAIRPEFSTILNGGKLTQQFCVDAYCKIEACRLKYIETHQKELRVENYKTLLAHIESRASERGLKPGKQVILPSSFCGSDRAMKQNYEDAMAIVAKKGTPDFFITMTCNPTWPEITTNLQPWQQAHNRPDLVARVFHLKLKELLHDLTQKHIFGETIGQIHVIEFQKRGLPHAHILLIMGSADRPKESELIDKLISAEFPNPNKFPKLHEYVKKHMVHGPCGPANLSCVCMVDNVCTKGFPKDFVEKTDPNVNGYPLYRRRHTGEMFTVGKHQVDNSWIVPYCPYLLLKFNCHINVEVCASVKSVK